MRDGSIAFEHRKADDTTSTERAALLAELGVLASHAAA
jgi:sulfonate transport system ATP-binding protein